MVIINMFHINIRNFHNNDRPNKSTLKILSQLKITKVNIIENFGNENNKIPSKKIQKYKNTKKKGKQKKEKEKKKEIIIYCVFCLPQWSSYCCLIFESF